jgi:hypothetical protein
MRSFENRDDTVVSDEPFYAYYLKRTGLNHPGRDLILKAQSSIWTEVISSCMKEIPTNKTIWYQKHMAHHFFEDKSMDWIVGSNNCLLIRNPEYVISSFKKNFLIKSSSQLGYDNQLKIYDIVTRNTGSPPIIIDSKDLLTNPKIILEKLCENLGISFSTKMLSWPKGRRKSDGVWAKYWYKNVEKSKGFIKYKKNNTTLDKSEKIIYDECFPIYNKLFQLRIKV